MGIELPWRLYNALQDVKKPLAILDAYSLFESDSAVIDHIGHILDIFHRCQTNRNHLAHSEHELSGADDAFQLRKGVKSTWDKLNRIEIPLPRLRQFADDMFSAWNHAWDVWAYLQQRDLSEKMNAVFVTVMPTSLPEKPFLPDTVNPSQSLRTPTTQGSPPNASPA